MRIEIFTETFPLKIDGISNCLKIDLPPAVGIGDGDPPAIGDEHSRETWLVGIPDAVGVAVMEDEAARGLAQGGHREERASREKQKSGNESDHVPQCGSNGEHGQPRAKCR